MFFYRKAAVGLVLFNNVIKIAAEDVSYLSNENSVAFGGDLLLGAAAVVGAILAAREGRPVSPYLIAAVLAFFAAGIRRMAPDSLRPHSL